MPRPRKWRNVCDLPRSNRFGPLGRAAGRQDPVKMTVDEYETIRLIDAEGFTQEECAQQMQVARTTVQSIYAQARKKLAQVLVDGQALIIEGGDYQLCNGAADGCGRGCQQRGRGRGPRRSGPLRP